MFYIVVVIGLLKSAAMHVDEEEAEDLLETIEESLKQRKWGEVIRLEIESQAPREVVTISRRRIRNRR